MEGHGRQRKAWGEEPKVFRLTTQSNNMRGILRESKASKAHRGLNDLSNREEFPMGKTIMPQEPKEQF